MKEEKRKEGCCELCGKEWQPNHFGNPRRCAFEGEKFSPANWNCGLVSTIRAAMYDNEDEAFALRVRRDFGAGSIGALVIEIRADGADDPFEYEMAGLLVATWYKDRGTTDSLEWAVNVYSEDKEVTREQAMKIAKYLEAQP